MGELSSEKSPLHVRTPLIESRRLSQKTGCTVLLKLENTQPSFSFKIRGIGNVVQLGAERGFDSIVSSSGGNAGLASAYAARQVGLRATIFVPETTNETVRLRLADEGASVRVVGRVFDEADAAAREKAETDPKCLHVHPFVGDDLWEGHATLVDELARDLVEGRPPDLIVVAVGGGGLLAGVVRGIRRHGWQDAVKVVAMETEGADCLSAALEAGRPVTLKEISSVAKTLGSLRVADEAFAVATSSRPPVASEVVSDARALRSCVEFADDHKMAVEPSCGAALSAVYDENVFGRVTEGKKGLTVVVVVCGGVGVSVKSLTEWERLQL